MWEEQVSEQKWIHLVQQRGSLSDQHSFVHFFNLNHFKAWEIKLTGKAVGWSVVEVLQGGIQRVTRLYVYSVLCCEPLRLEQQSPVSLTSWNATMLSCPLPAQMFAVSKSWTQRLYLELAAEDGWLSLDSWWWSETRCLLLVRKPRLSWACFFCRCWCGWRDCGSGGSSGEKPCWSCSGRQRQPSLPLHL